MVETSCKHVSPLVFEGETITLVDAIAWFKEINLHVIMEFDCKHIVECLANDNLNHIELGSILLICK